MNKDHIVREYSKHLQNGAGAMFIGSGFSTLSGVPSWESLLAPLADSRLQMDSVPPIDLTELAQYIVNEAGGNRGALIAHMRESLGRSYLTNKYHRALTQTKISTIWTTNQDTLIEQAFREEGLSVTVKATDDAISRGSSNPEVEVIKMHGSIDSSPHDDIVITQADYEDFFVRRPATAQRLSADMLSKSFLFVGYGYNDPNIRNIVVRARRLARRATRQHFMVTVRRTKAPDDHLQQLWCENLQRYGIECLLLEDYAELPSILQAIARKSRGPSVYVTGSHLDSTNKTATALGASLARKPDLILIDGQSAGVSNQAVSAFLEAAIVDRVDISSRLKIFPNPYAANPEFSSRSELLPTLKAWRAPLLRSTQVVVFFDGRMGTEAEVGAALAAGCRLVPVPGLPGQLVEKVVSENPAILDSLPAEYVARFNARTVEPEDIAACVYAITRE